MTSEQHLCLLSELPDGESIGLIPLDGRDQVFAIRQKNHVYVYRNLCPHNMIPMEFLKNQFLNADKSEIICYAHGAHFNIESGICTKGICEGESLFPIPVRIENDSVILLCKLPTNT